MRINLFFFGFFFFTITLLAQNTGDFRTKTTGPVAWNDSNSWQIFNGNNWVNATAYPGQIAGTYSVLVQSGHTITNPNTPNNFGALTINGTLNLGGNSNYVLNASSVKVTEDLGIIVFLGNNDLILPANTVLTVYPDGLETDRNCTASQRIRIGDIVFATCNGNGPGDPISFDILMEVNGSLLSVINSNFPDCSSDTVATLIPSYIGLAGSNNSFRWEIIAPDNTLSNTNSSPLALELSQNGDYTIKLIYTTNYPGGTYTNTRTIVYNNKVTVWNGTSWNGGTPDINTRVLIDGKYEGPSFSACSLKITSNGELLVPSNQFIEVEGIVINQGVFQLENNASLMQKLNVTNSGNINYKRIANEVNRFDYVYWSSPVSNFNIANITGTNKFYWNPLFNNANGSQGNWISFPNGIMNEGSGYIVRAPNNFPVQGQPASTITTNFIGVPNNGTYNVAVSRGNNTNSVLDNNNLVGNPYPSAISIESFLIKNAIDNPAIEGAVRLWTHGSAPSVNTSSPFYQNFGYNYSVDDYITINLTGTIRGFEPITTIGAGQGFFIAMREGPQATENIVFENDMRTKRDNDMFFRTAANTQTKHRIWLDILDANFNMSRTLIGYIDGATDGKDVLYDASHSVEATSLNIYSHIDEYDLSIQGRSFPFNNQDKVDIGVKVAEAGNYSLAIGVADGIFGETDQNIFIEDLELGIIHNIRVSPYEVFLTQGNHKDRFIMRYTSETLSVNDAELGSNDIIISKQLDGIHIKSNKEIIHSVTVFNILGQKVSAFNKVNAYNLDIVKTNQANDVSIINIILDNGQVVNKKIIF